jgi:hypothetical protein
MLVAVFLTPQQIDDGQYAGGIEDDDAINQASCLLRALFHMPMHFQTPSQMARRMIMGSSTASQAGN